MNYVVALPLRFLIMKAVSFYAYERVRLVLGVEKLLVDLRRIAMNDFLLAEGECVEKYLEPMLMYIGVTDSELRDTLIYETFREWIGEKAYVKDDKLR